MVFILTNITSTYILYYHAYDSRGSWAWLHHVLSYFSAALVSQNSSCLMPNWIQISVISSRTVSWISLAAWSVSCPPVVLSPVKGVKTISCYHGPAGPIMARSCSDNLHQSKYSCLEQWGCFLPIYDPLLPNTFIQKWNLPKGLRCTFGWLSCKCWFSGTLWCILVVLRRKWIARMAFLVLGAKNWINALLCYKIWVEFDHFT